MRVILASSSPRRREILGRIIGDFEIIKPHIDETQQPDEAPKAYAKRLSREKAAAVAAQLNDTDAVDATSILAADTVVIVAADTMGIDAQGDILGKPADADEARAMLRRLCDDSHEVCTAFTLRKGDTIHTEIVCTTVTMRRYTDDEIDAYIATGDPFDKAGSYAIQHEGFHPVAQIVGSYSNVVGLPEDNVRAALQAIGVTVKSPSA